MQQLQSGFSCKRLLATVKKKTLRNSDDSPSGSAHLSEFPCSEGFDVARRRLAEVAAVFATEMTDTFVSDPKGTVEASSPSSSIRPRAACSRSCFLILNKAPGLQCLTKYVQAPGGTIDLYERPFKSAFFR